MIKPSVLAAGLLLACCQSIKASAQDTSLVKPVGNDRAEKTHAPADSVQEKDLIDCVDKLRHKHTKTIFVDTVTAKPSISFIPAIGYTLTSGLGLVLSGNAAFRTGADDRISTITASTSFSQKKQFTVPVESIIWLDANKFLLIGDYRFYAYPQSTYGLGSNSRLSNEDPMDFTFVRFYQTAMRHVTGNFYLGSGYIFDFHGDVDESGNKNQQPADFKTYLPLPHTVSTGFTANGLLDSRDNSIAATKGYYAAFQLRENYRFMGSTNKWGSLILDLRHYINFPAGSSNVLALWSYDWLVLNGKPPYLDLPATSWDPYTSTGRGYIQGRFRGAQMVYAEAEYRYRISANGLFGGVFFLNAQSFSAAPGTRLQTVQPGFGPGLRVKLNKLTKTNVCIDYGFGTQGSKGLFVNVGEMF
jgi:hypothetical protein